VTQTPHQLSVKTATKTGTSDKGGNAKDLWMMSYSPAVTMGVWLGNPDTTILKNGTSSLGSPIIASVMEYTHKEVYAPQGLWKSGDWFAQPSGIQRIGNEVYPSWWNKSQGLSNAELTFDRVSKKKATSCTPDGAKETINVVKSIDPVTKKDIYRNVPSGYDATKDDDTHNCNDAKPIIGAIDLTTPESVTVTVTPGKFSLPASGVTIKLKGNSLPVTKSGNTYTATYTGTVPASGEVSVTAIDSGYYTVTKTN
jgi:membrane peptidoglycan carboxypeptidase